MSQLTHADYLELLQGIIEDLKPDQPVVAAIVEITDPRNKRKSNKLAIKLDVLRGPQTQVIFNFSDVHGKGVKDLNKFVTEKLVSIGVHVAEVREEVIQRITDAPEKPETPSPAEAAKVLELLTARRPAPAPVAVAPSLQVDESEVVLEETATEPTTATERAEAASGFFGKGD